MVQRDLDPKADEEIARMIFESKDLVEFLGLDRDVSWGEFRKTYEVDGSLDISRLFAEVAAFPRLAENLTPEDIVNALLAELDSAKRKGNIRLANYAEELLANINWDNIKRN